MPSQHDTTISRISEKQDRLRYYYKTAIIQGPKKNPLIFAVREDGFLILDINTGKENALSHPGAKKVVRIDDNTFATASAFSIKLWRFDDLAPIKEYKIFKNTVHQPYKADGVVRGLQVLSGKFLISFTSTGYCGNTVYSDVFAVNLETGQTLQFDLSRFNELMYYNIAAIPNKQNQFVLYDYCLHGDRYIFEMDEKQGCLKLIATHQNLEKGAFYNLAISPDGQYWAVDMRYSANKKPTFGVQVYKVDENYNLTCIAKMFEADKPQWNGTKLLYSFEDRICEFNPEDLSHTLLTDKGSYVEEISPFLSDGYFQVARCGTWETYNIHKNSTNYATDCISQLDSHTRLPKDMIKIMGDYLEVDTISKKSFHIIPLKKFGLHTLFKKPSENGLIDIKDQETTDKKSKIK